jgi:hypothetical protein
MHHHQVIIATLRVLEQAFEQIALIVKADD